MGETPRPDPERVEARAGDLLPDEVGSADPEAQAAAILADSDERERDRAGGAVEHRRSGEAGAG